jgi:hypothetical protein
MIFPKGIRSILRTGWVISTTGRFKKEKLSIYKYDFNNDPAENPVNLKKYFKSIQFIYQNILQTG